MIKFLSELIYVAFPLLHDAVLGDRSCLC